MHTIINEFVLSARRIINLYGFESLDDPKEREYFEYVELGRQRTNLKRTLLFSVLLILLIIATIVIPITRNSLNTSLMVLSAVAVVILLVFIHLVERYYMNIDENYKDAKFRCKVSALYIIYWGLYYVMIALCFESFSGKLQSVILWIVMVFIALSLPMFNRKEFFFIAPVAVLSAAVYLYFSHLSLNVILTCLPVVLMLLVVTQTNHLQRLQSFYDSAINRAESVETKRRLGKVFEEVFDLAFEFDVKNNVCYVLRQNAAYDITKKELLGVENFMDDFKTVAHPDDLSIVERNFSFTYLNDEFIMGRSQIYFEIRIKNTEGNYRWISVLITKESEVSTSDYLLCLIQDIEERKKNEDKLRLEAEKDPLTQLYNKMTTKSLIEECFEKNSSAQHALIIIDIDNFKTINDTRGHVVGDQILLAFAAELNKNFRETDILGRAGGDEFIVLIKNVQSIAMVCDKLQRLTASFKKYGIDHGFPGRLSTSIGVAMFNKDGKGYEELFKKADAALYEAKRNGKDQYKFSISRTE